MKQLPIVDTDNDTFQGLVAKVNGIIDLCNTEVVTANNHSDGAITTGKGYVIGSFGSNTLSCDVLSGGNTVANGVLTIVSNTVFVANTYQFTPGIILGNNLSHNHTVSANTTGTTQQTVDSFTAAAYRSAKYVISATDSSANQYQVTEILLLHDGSTTFTTEYATISSNNQLVTFTSDIYSGSVRLRATPTVSALTINVSRTLIST